MRKAQKQQILECIESLRQAHGEIQNALNQEKTESAQNMLGECQEFVVALGEAIEQAEGVGHVTVTYIEDYCETLFYIYQGIAGGEMNENKAGKLLRKKLLKIENSIKNDINIRKEIVFFPYKASMWDSLESIYLAARSDPSCDAYCVPIPYYDRDSAGGLGTMHYEGGEYPKNIEVIDWRTYNFEERRPDEIYIHNPYDDINLVTSVHPRFYARNLKQYTEKLVYVPYFVLGEIDPENQKSVENMKHFCYLPGVFYADKVIVESENVRKVYIEEYIKAAKANGLGGAHLDRGYLEQKILGIGSPKYDKVLNMKKEEIEIPEAWRRIIEKPDGTYKKIVLYNTSIAMLLQHNEKMLAKMENVFRLFREYKNEITLLWRPHPLIKSTIEGMRPHLKVLYEKMINEYVEGGWGIYDDTPDFNRAVALSDAYYGDNSSVVQIYRQTGKPIMLQSVYHFSDACEQYFGRSLMETKKKLLFSCIKQVGEITFAFSSKNNGLFQVLEDGRAEYIASIPNEKMWIKNLYIDMVLWRDFLFLIPGKAKEIAKFHIKTYEIEKISVDLPLAWNSNTGKFVGAFVWNRELILLPERYPAIVRMDLYSEICMSELIQETEFCFKKGYYWDGKCVYLPSNVAGFVLKYNVEDNEMERVDIPGCGQGIWSLAESDGLKYLVSFPDSDVICWNEKNIQFSTMPNIVSGYSGNGYGSSVIIHTREKLIVFPIKGNFVLEVDISAGVVKKSDINWKYEEGKVYAYIAKDLNHLYFYHYQEKEGYFGDRHGEILEVNTDTLIIRRQEYWIEDLACILQASGEIMFYERYGIEIDEFLKMVLKDMGSKKTAFVQPCGYKIYRELADEKM